MSRDRTIVDLAAHMLWTGVAATLAAPRAKLDRYTIAATIALSALPDVAQLLPLFAWVIFGDGTWSAVLQYANALPGQEPALPNAVRLVSHHLHCAAHSAVVAATVGVVSWVATRKVWVPLLGWWAHVAIDVFTHSADFYPVRVLYPFSDWSFDGVAWNEPRFLLLNYTALATAWAWAICRSRWPGPAARARGART